MWVAISVSTWTFCGVLAIAAALITAAFAIAAPPAKVKASLPFLAWLSELSGFPKEVIKSQAASILQHVMP